MPGIAGGVFERTLGDQIEALIGPAINDLGFLLVRVQVSGRQRPRLQVMIERADGRPINVDDCADVSRTISAVLDVADPVAGAYTLEVSSPGIDRPLVKLDDYQRFAGHEARIELGRLIDGRRRLQGTLAGVEGERVRLIVGDQTWELPYADIVRAKLVLTDDLLTAHERTELAGMSDQ